MYRRAYLAALVAATLTLTATTSIAQTTIDVTLNGSPLSNLDDLFISPDGTTLVLNGEFDSDGGGFPSDILLRAPITGGAATILTGPAPAGDADDIGISPTGVVFFAGDSDPTGALGLTGNDNDYFSIPITGSFPGTTPTQLTTDLTTPFEVDTPRFSPDGSTFYFNMEIFDDGTTEEFVIASMPAGGGTITQLTPTIGNPGAVPGIGDQNGFDITADGTTIVFAADPADIGEDQGLFTIPSTGGTPTAIPLPAFDPTADIDDIALTPDGQTIVFIADLLADGVNELFTVPITGGTPKRISTEPVSGGDVQLAEISPDGSKVIYVSDEVTNGTDELFLVSINGGPNRRINPDVVQGDDGQGGLEDVGDVVDNNPGGADFTPDGNSIIYIGDIVTDGFREIFIVDTPLLGDFNDDGVVDARDYTVARDNLGAADDSSINDNGDGVPGVTLTDLAIWANNLGAVAPASPGVAVPEPSAAVLLLGLLALSVRRSER